MTKIALVNEGQKPTKEQLAEIEALKDRPVLIDEEMPELTPEMFAALKEAAKQKREERRKQVLTLRVSPETMQRAKALGKGYTGILSRILELALEQPDIIKKCL